MKRPFLLLPFLLCLLSCKEAPSLIPPNEDPLPVFLLAGQSNMEGYTNGKNLYSYCFDNGKSYQTYTNGYSNAMITYKGLTGNHSSSEDGSPNFVPVCFGQGLSEGYLGPELGIAESLQKQNKNAALIKYACGGAGLYHAQQFLSPSKGGNNNLFTGMIDYAKSALEQLKQQDYKPILKGIVWMQGETDAMNESTALLYEENWTAFIADAREELKEYAQEENGENIHIVDATIDEEYWEFQSIINSAKKNVASSLKNVSVVSTGKTGLNLQRGSAQHGGGDDKHYNLDSMIKLGNAFGEEIGKNLL